MKKIILIYGSGGHGRVVADAVESRSARSRVFFFDDATQPYNSKFKRNRKLVIGIGNNEVRKKVSETISHAFGTVIHPSAQIAKDVEIGEGTVVLANAVIQTGAVIGKHCIINANVVIDHDVVIGDFVSIYPGAYIGGNAIVTELKTIEPNQVVERNAVL